MGGTPSVDSMLAGAKKALDSANKFTSNVTGGKPNAFAPKADAKPAESKYAPVRAARKNPDEFMGVRSNEAPELKTALDAREQAKKALDQ